MSHTRTAIVTGSASGVGLASVARLRARGLDVVGVDLDPTPDEGGAGKLTSVTGSVAEQATWDEVAALCAEDRAPAALVLNAGRLIVGPVTGLTDDDWHAVFDVNVFGAVKALRTVLPLMGRAGGGAVVFVASTDGFLGEQNLAAYCASKGAVLQLMRSVALDYARQGIRANAIAPGSIDTPFFRRHVDAAPDPQEFLAQKTDRHPAGRLLEGDDVAQVVDFLASPAAIGMTGSVVTVDGGLTACFDYYPEQAVAVADRA